MTFSLEQIREIRKTIEQHRPNEWNSGGIIGPAIHKTIDQIIASFPLPKVKVYRTYRSPSGAVYRVVDDIVEGDYGCGWETSGFFGGPNVTNVITTLAKVKNWTLLSGILDLVQNPTELVDP